MRIKKFAAATALAIAAIGLIENTAVAAPAPVSADIVSDIPERTEGVDRGVSYVVQRDDRTLAADITGGTFRVNDDAIEVIAKDGTSIASIPRALPIGEHVVTLAPRIEANGTKLVADVSAQEIGYWRKTSPKQRSIEAGIGIGGLIGGLAGAVVGIVIGIAGMGLLLPIALPIGLIVGVLGGMAIGGAAGAAVPNSDVPDQWDYQEECEYHGNYKFCW
ncbi:hypothetical protein [Nocardia cyriacigeorgica]|uniref:hypothetical protein n=1 Tax=Nocardia cyriacigeorgica TaxID=135487 RepID=UPI00245381AE|nr:hypothetical protein [Nocardia cyriacigeorgica]